jgi:tetrahydromethanopterin S-methyltransferase subunit G
MIRKLLSRKDVVTHPDPKELTAVHERLSSVEKRVDALTLQVKLIQRKP